MRYLFLIFFGALGIMFLVVGTRQVLQQRRLLSRAIPVPARIVAASVRMSQSADTDPRPLRSTSTTTHEPCVRFAYEVQGAAYESELLRPTDIVRTFPSAEGARAELEPFPVGAKVTAFVNPDSPDRAFLIAEPSAAPTVLVVLGFVAPLFGALLARFA
jgi:hypothetical protein